MLGAFRDLVSVVDELNGYCARILEPDRDALTSLQKQAFQDKLAREIKKAGISFSVSHDTDRGSYDYSNIFFSWSSPLCVRGTGTIVDVLTVGDYPIRLALAKHVSVRFEPRHLGDWEGRHRVSNHRFAHLRKGDSYEFRGLMSYGRYFFKETPDCRFEFDVEREGAVARFFRGLFGR